MASKKSVTLRRPTPPPSHSRPRLDVDFDGDEHRKFPRAQLSMPVSLWIERDGERRFSATLKAENLSVCGAFLRSTFFLPKGTQLRIRFTLEAEDGDPVDALAEVVRVEQPDSRTGEGRSGLAIRFIEFFEKTEVTLARLFLGQRLTEFARDYLESKRARSLDSELERVVDALAAWELLKVTQPKDVWLPEGMIDVP